MQQHVKAGKLRALGVSTRAALAAMPGVPPIAKSLPDFEAIPVVRHRRAERNDGIRAPMLLGGPDASTLQPTLEKLGFNATVGSESLGVVSAIKLCRSVFVKGMEALAIEGLLAARHYGVEREVLASLVETYPGLDWERQATWSWRRVVQHGRRRAEEMREAAVTVADAGLDPRMASAIADVQQSIATLRANGAFEAARADATWRELADLVSRESNDSK